MHLMPQDKTVPSKTNEERLLERRLRNRAAVELLKSWDEEGDETEQRETLEFLKVAIDANRLGQRKHFP
jgi:hypothetical protein